jgi:hypothetical protein
MTSSWPATDARRTAPRHWSATSGWSPRLPAAGWRTSFRTLRLTQPGCGPPHPTLRCRGVLAGHQHRLVRDQELLLDGHRRLADAQAKFGTGMNGRFPAHLVSVVSDRVEISELSASLVNTARRDWMTLENLATDMPLTEDFAQPPLPTSTGHVRCRPIYEAAAMDDPVARDTIHSCAEAGEQARLLPKIPMKMKLADHTTAMLPLTPTGTAGALVIRAPVIIGALREYFELLWDRATPL